jgi:hypothetical protein
METASARREDRNGGPKGWRARAGASAAAGFGHLKAENCHRSTDSTHSNARGVTQTVGRTLETPRSKVGDAIDGRSPGSRVGAFRSAFPVVASDQWRVVSVGSSRTVAGAATACALSSLAEIERTVFPFHPTRGTVRSECYSATNPISSRIARSLLGAHPRFSETFAPKENTTETEKYATMLHRKALCGFMRHK